MVREKQMLDWSHNGSSVNCPMPDCEYAVEFGGAQLYKVWFGHPNFPPPSKFDVECEMGCELKHDFLFPPHEKMYQWIERTIKRLKLAFDYCSTDPDAALAKYRQVGEHTMEILSLFFTNKQISSKDTTKPIKDAMAQWCKDKQNSPTIPYQPHEKTIDSFVNGMTKLNQGVHNWSEDATKNSAQSAKFDTVNFVQYVLQKIILPPFRPLDLIVDEDSLEFCQSMGCASTLTFVGTVEIETELNNPIPMAGGEDLTSWHTKKYNFVCSSCNTSA